MIKGPKKTVSLLLTQEDYDRLKTLARDNCRTVPSYLRVMVHNYLYRLDRPETKLDDWWVVR